MAKPDLLPPPEKALYLHEDTVCAQTNWAPLSQPQPDPQDPPRNRRGSGNSPQPHTSKKCQPGCHAP